MASKSTNPDQSADQLWYLYRSSLLSGLASSSVVKFAHLCNSRTYDKRENIFVQGEINDCLYLVNLGVVELWVGDSSNRGHIISFVKSGGVFGEDILGPKATRQVSARAHDFVRVSVLHRAHLLGLLTEDTSLLINFVQVLGQRAIELEEDIRRLSLLNLETRLLEILLSLGAIHGRPTGSNGNLIRLATTITHEELASLAGANRPNVSSMMSKLRKEGCLAYKGSQLVVDIGQLRAAQQAAVAAKRNSNSDSQLPGVARRPMPPHGKAGEGRARTV